MKKTFFIGLLFELFLAFWLFNGFNAFCVNAFGIGSAWDAVAVVAVAVAVRF